MSDKVLSVIIPAFNEEKMISKACETIRNILKVNSISYELIFVDDGSKDYTWCEIEKESGKDSRVKGVSFSRNFGKESAILAGLTHSTGDCAVVIDCDLQHPPVKIVEMYNLWLEGYEVVEAVKRSRGNESFIHSFMACTFYSIISKAVNIDMMNASDFKLLDRKAVLALINIREKGAFFRALSSWIGFKTTQIEFDVQERTEGTSKWSTWSLFKYALTNITSFSSAPMQIVTILGVVLFVLSLILFIEAFVTWIKHQALPGFTTVIMFQAFSSSVIMISLGVIGFYISRIFDEVKGRPNYIVSKECGTAEKLIK